MHSSHDFGQCGKDFWYCGKEFCLGGNRWGDPSFLKLNYDLGDSLACSPDCSAPTAAPQAVLSAATPKRKISQCLTLKYIILCRRLREDCASSQNKPS